MPVTLVETDSYPIALQAPAAGELASAPNLVSTFLQGAANRFKWLQTRVNKFVAGGSLSSTGNVALTTISGASYQVNDLAIPSVDDGGGLTIGVGNLAVTQGTVTALVAHFPGFVRSGLRIAAGNIAAGVHTYSTDNFQHIYSVAGPSVGVGCVWKIDDSASSGEEWFRFVNFNADQIQVHNPSGVLLQIIKFGTGFAYGITVARLSGVWTVIDASYSP